MAEVETPTALLVMALRDLYDGENALAGWLPPDPPSGHGPHDYVFQLFALDTPVRADAGVGRSALIDAMEGHVLSAAVLTGTYERR